MILFWTSGLSIYLFLYIFKDKNADLRFIIFGSLFPVIFDHFKNPPCCLLTDIFICFFVSGPHANNRIEIIKKIKNLFVVRKYITTNYH